MDSGVSCSLQIPFLDLREKSRILLMHTGKSSLRRGLLYSFLHKELLKKRGRGGRGQINISFSGEVYKGLWVERRNEKFHLSRCKKKRGLSDFP